MNTIFSVRIMKRLALTTALCVTFVSVAYVDNLNIKTMTPGVLQIDTESYILTGCNPGKVLVEQNTGVHRDPTSLTKMMISYVIGRAMEAGKPKETDLVVISNNAWTTGNPVFKGSPPTFLKLGMQAPVSQLIHGINPQSGNNACVIMADSTVDSQDAFVGLVNNYVNVPDLENIHLQTVHDLDADGQYSSVRDIALVGQALICDIPNEYSIYKEGEFTFDGIHQLNHSGLLWGNSLSVDGIKIGHTDKAGYNLVTPATEGQMCLISTVTDGRTSKDREAESKKLLTQGFRFFETVNPLKVGKEFASEPIWFDDFDRASLGVGKGVYLAIPRDHTKDLKASYILNSSKLHVPLQENQVVGTINFQLDGKTIEQRPLVVLQGIPEGNFLGKIIGYVRLMSRHWSGQKLDT